MKRRHFLQQFGLVAAASVVGCGGSTESPSSTAPGTTPAPGPSPTPPPPPSPPPPQLGAGIATLSLHPSQSGTAPYSAAVYPLEGRVPSGQSLASDDDPGLRASVLSRWPDGSASVVVVAGETALAAGSVKNITLRAATSAGTPLTPARIGQMVSDVAITFGGLGTAGISDFSSPQKIWWANERTICCRYVVPVTGDQTLEAIVDIHAYSSGRAFVEIVVENGRIAASSPAPAAPSAKVYTATITVNGAPVATVMSSSGPSGTHEAFRAWYASHWVGGDPGVEVTHDTGSMQRHPLLFRVWRSGGDPSQYASDKYSPWSVGRHPAKEMHAGGDSPQIGPLPRWECHYLQTGAKEARRAVIASALGMLTFGVNYRDAATGFVPRLDAVHPKRMSGAQDWPQTRSEPTIDGGAAHHGAAGLMAFLCRPSPVFIEVAQKLATWNGTNFSTTGEFHNDYQQRGYAWCMRSLAHAIFLTPDGEGWKEAARRDLYLNVQRGLSFKNNPINKLDFIWDTTTKPVHDFEPNQPGCQQPTFQVAYIVTELSKVADAKLLSGAQQDDLVTLADWVCRFPVRFVNEAVGGEWRAVGSSRLTVSSGSDNFVESNWAAVQAFEFSGDVPPPVPGKWLSGRGVNRYSLLSPDEKAGAYYPSYFWAALATAADRDIPGAATAWTKVTQNITNLASWSDGFIADPRWGAYPRNK